MLHALKEFKDMAEKRNVQEYIRLHDELKRKLDVYKSALKSKRPPSLEEGHSIVG